jgi:hypothetical protein
MSRLARRLSPLFVAVAALVGLARTTPAVCCPFCTLQGQTLTGEMAQAKMVLYGTLGNANEEKETTDMAVETVVKDHPSRGKTKKLTLDRYIPPSLDGSKYKYLVFFDLFRGKFDPYRGVAVKPDSKMPEYLAGAFKVKDKPLGERLRFFFDWLDNPDIEIANDAYKEFGNVDYNDYKAMAARLPAERIIKWLEDADTPSFRIGLYASMLGHCGKGKFEAASAKALKAILDDADKRVASSSDGVMAGYVMLRPKEGWKYILDTLRDSKSEFTVRFAALRAVRFLRDYRSDLVSKKDLLAGVCTLLNQDDIADLAIEDLRKWQQWDLADRVLAVQKTEVYKQNIVKRAILRYCLQCKGSKAAAAYVAEQRKADAEAVQDAEELLELDARPAPTPPDPAKKK